MESLKPNQLTPSSFLAGPLGRRLPCLLLPTFTRPLICPGEGLFPRRAPATADDPASRRGSSSILTDLLTTETRFKIQSVHLLIETRPSQVGCPQLKTEHSCWSAGSVEALSRRTAGSLETATITSWRISLSQQGSPSQQQCVLRPSSLTSHSELASQLLPFEPMLIRQSTAVIGPALR